MRCGRFAHYPPAPLTWPFAPRTSASRVAELATGIGDVLRSAAACTAGVAAYGELNARVKINY